MMTMTKMLSLVEADGSGPVGVDKQVVDYPTETPNHYYFKKTK